MNPEQQIERLRALSKRSEDRWVLAARAALKLLPEASRSNHPAHDLWLRVALADEPAVEVVLS